MSGFPTGLEDDLKHTPPHGDALLPGRATRRAMASPEIPHNDAGVPIIPTADGMNVREALETRPWFHCVWGPLREGVADDFEKGLRAAIEELEVLLGIAVNVEAVDECVTAGIAAIVEKP